jgi:tetratricopeptide (TPR) repeat protein
MQYFRKLTLRVRPHTAIVIVLIVYGSIILLTFREYGITNDEPIHIEYGEALVDWYSSFGLDDRVLSLDKTYLYGGLFDSIGQLAAMVSPFDPYETKHLCNALFGLLGIIAAYRIGYLLGGTNAGLLAAGTLLLTPRYYGHAFNNGKDIPFAVFYLWSVYYLAKSVATFPRNPRKLAIWTGVSIGLTLSIRVGGVLLFGYLGLFFGIAWLMSLREEERQFDNRSVVVSLVTMGAIAIALMLFFWPLALMDPFLTPFETISRFSSFPDSHWSFFDGEHLNSLNTPRRYVPQWMLITLPELVIFGLGVGLIIALSRWRRWYSRRGLQHALIAFSGLFPVAYAVLSKPALYDGMRHFMFVLPPLAVLAGVSLAKGFEIAKKRTAIGLAAVVILCGGLVANEMVRLHPNQVVYFNHLIAGGVDTAWRDYETDYWRHAQKQAAVWISEAYGSEFDRPIRTSSRFVGTRHQMPENLQLVDFRASPDFYIGSTRHDEHLVIPGEIVHIIRAGEEAELVYVIRPDDSYLNDPFFTESWFADLHRLKIYLRYAEYVEDKGSPVAAARGYLNLARCYERLRKRADRVSLTPAELAEWALYYQVKAVNLIPSAQDAETVAGRYFDEGEFLGARDILMGLTSVYPNHDGYLEKLILTLIQTGEYDDALARCEQWLQDKPQSSRPGLLGVTASIAAGDLDLAEAYLEKAARLHPASAEIEANRQALDQARREAANQH